MVTRMRNHFWDRWRKEVLQLLQTRSKWLDINDNLKVGDLVLLPDETHLPTKWPTARVLECSPGNDGLVRVVKLQTEKSIFTRPVTKIIRLPIDDEPLPTFPEATIPADTLMVGG